MSRCPGSPRTCSANPDSGMAASQLSRRERRARPCVRCRSRRSRAAARTTDARLRTRRWRCARELPRDDGTVPPQVPRCGTAPLPLRYAAIRSVILRSAGMRGRNGSRVSSLVRRGENFKFASSPLARASATTACEPPVTQGAPASAVFRFDLTFDRAKPEHEKPGGDRSRV
jgi:hypothetical protein